MRAPASEVAKLGVEIEVADGVNAEAVRHPDGRVDVLELHTDADLIVVQRPLDHSMTGIIEQAHRQGIATVVEIDDDFSTVHTQNIAHDAMIGDLTGNHWVEKACSIADHVTVSTPQLTKYARHGRVSILRNNVPDDIFKTSGARNFNEPRIGWTGSVQTHPDDLQQTKRAVADVLRTNRLNFNVIGDGQYVASNLSLDKSTSVFATGWVPIEEYYEALSQHLDIGIVPLELSPFNEAKSALKGLEYAAIGIPFVASPTREYLRMEAYGIGKTAKSPGEWRKHLQRMIDRTSETERLANEARDRIEAEHTYSVNAPQWIEAWEKAIAYRKT
jgi:glycosyltransferase involved in cell wall biosynthesis